MTDEELACFIRKIYLHGKNEDGFDFCDFNLEAWLIKTINDTHLKEEIDTHLTEIWDKESSDCDLWQKDRTCIGCYRYDICKQAEQNKIKL